MCHNVSDWRCKDICKLVWRECSPYNISFTLCARICNLAAYIQMCKLSLNIVPNVYDSLQSSFWSLPKGNQWSDGTWTEALAWPWLGRSLPKGNQWKCWDPGLGPNVVGLPVHLPPQCTPNTPNKPPISLPAPIHPDTPTPPDGPKMALMPPTPQEFPMPPDAPYTPCKPPMHPWHLYTHWWPSDTHNTPTSLSTPLCPLMPQYPLWFSIVITFPLTLFMSMSSLQYAILRCQEYIFSAVKLSQFLQYLPKHALKNFSCFTTLKDQQSGLDMKGWLTILENFYIWKTFYLKG